ncbi:MAG: hypothetical protein LC109_07735 [Bacteroidia bacterium]|nr:hypothetical protein [Bacteroidia bacterium]MCO5253861.1 hypothetical protein [Bacteroidota bacterium]MCZ2130146.1 hypothetical protein [Bacteroidia bacterium]
MKFNVIKNTLMGLIVVLTLVFIFMLMSEDSDVVASTKESAAISFGLIFTYILCALSIVTALFMAGRGLINKPKSSIYMGLGLVGILVIFGIFYAIDPGELTATYIKGGVTTTNASKVIGGALKATYALVIISVIISVTVSVRDVFNKNK